MRGSRRVRLGTVFVAMQVLLLGAFLTLPRVWRAGWDTGAWWGSVGWTLVAVGVVLAVAAGVALGRHLTPFPEPRSSSSLVTSGPYRFARHPIYGGVLLAALGWTLASGSLAVATLTGVALVFFDAKRRYEERVLHERFEGYGTYREATRVFVPFVL